MNGSPEHHSAYFAVVSREDAKLQERLAEIRRQEDEGKLTVRQAAIQRISAMEQHLAALRLFRDTYLGSE